MILRVTTFYSENELQEEAFHKNEWMDQDTTKDSYGHYTFN